MSSTSEPDAADARIRALLSALGSTLDDERQALAARDFDGLVGVTTRKAELVAELDAAVKALGDDDAARA
ncbi:MAG: hypothetical protein ACU85V_09435, partial [Gammaproteobacteria bacterium]